MKRISVDKIHPGMTLAKDVLNRDGRRLLPGNCRLTPKEIRILKMWGISEILVTDEDTAFSSEPQSPPVRNQDAAEKHMAAWFEQNDLNNPVIRVIYDICMERFLNGRFEPPNIFGDTARPAPGSDGSKSQSAAQVKQLLTTDLKLPSLPTIFSEINEAVKNPKCSGKDIADIVSKDPSLSARLLKIVNSAYYGLSEKVESLNYAAMALGTRQVSSLALGITVVNYFKGITNPKINMEAFWHHSVASGIAAKTLAARMSGVVSDRVFIGGLLHDIGWLVFLNTIPDECNLVFQKAKLLGLNVFQIEKKFFGMTHADFGSELATAWNFSEPITALIRHHHDPFKKKPPKEIALVHFANWFIDAIGIGFSGDRTIPRLNMNAWNALEIPDSVLAPTVKQIDRQMLETIKFFYE